MLQGKTKERREKKKGKYLKSIAKSKDKHEDTLPTQNEIKLLSQDEAKFITRVKIKKKKSYLFLFDEKALKVMSLVDVSPSKTTVFSYQFHN